MDTENNKPRITLDKENQIIKISGYDQEIEIPIVISQDGCSCFDVCPISHTCADGCDICNILGDRIETYNWYIDIPTEDGYRFRRTIATILGVKAGIIKKKIIFKRRVK